MANVSFGTGHVCVCLAKEVQEITGLTQMRALSQGITRTSHILEVVLKSRKGCAVLTDSFRGSL